MQASIGAYGPTRPRPPAVRRHPRSTPRGNTPPSATTATARAKLTASARRAGVLGRGEPGQHMRLSHAQRAPRAGQRLRLQRVPRLARRGRHVSPEPPQHHAAGRLELVPSQGRQPPQCVHALAHPLGGLTADRRAGSRFRSFEDAHLADSVAGRAHPKRSRYRLGSRPCQTPSQFASMPRTAQGGLPDLSLHGQH